VIESDFSNYFTKPEKQKQATDRSSLTFCQRLPPRHSHKSGRITDVLYNATLFKMNGTIQGVFAAARDITERKQAEEKLRATRSTQEALSKQVSILSSPSC